MKNGPWLNWLQHLALRLLAFALLISLGAMSLSFRPNPVTQAEDWDALPRQQAEPWQWWMLQGAQHAEELPIEDIQSRVASSYTAIQEPLAVAFEETIGATALIRENRTHLPSIFFQTQIRIPVPGYYPFLHLYTPF